jgi:hypothetical protein
VYVSDREVGGALQVWMIGCVLGRKLLRAPNAVRRVACDAIMWGDLGCDLSTGEEERLMPRRRLT